MAWLIILGVIAVIFLIIVISNIHIVPQAHAYVVERLGTYHTTWHTGLHVKTPFIDRIAKRISLMERVADFDPQAVITKDNVKMQIDTVVFFQITDCKLYAYGVENPMSAIENLTLLPELPQAYPDFPLQFRSCGQRAHILLPSVPLP